MKGIIFGNGYMGNRMFNYFKEQEGFDFKLSDLRVDSYHQNELDNLLREELDNLQDREEPYFVINAIGKTHGPGVPSIDWCEDNMKETWGSNVTAVCLLANACGIQNPNPYLVHLSSGCIYYGNNFTEEDKPNFVGEQFYADTKRVAEEALLTYYKDKSLILRIRMPIDDHPNERNLIDKLKEYDNIIDKPNSMTVIPDALPVIKKLIEEEETGIYNLVNPGIISAAVIMKMYRDIVNPNHEFSIMSLDELNKITTSKRSNCTLNTDKLKSKGIFMPDIIDSVERCLYKYKRHIYH